jgi:hypothetical protein
MRKKWWNAFGKYAGIFFETLIGGEMGDWEINEGEAEDDGESEWENEGELVIEEKVNEDDECEMEFL